MDLDGEEVDASRFQVNQDGRDCRHPGRRSSTSRPCRSRTSFRSGSRSRRRTGSSTTSSRRSRRCTAPRRCTAAAFASRPRIDMDLQAAAQQALETWISEFESSAYGHNGALVAMDPRTSEVLVYVGSRDYFADTYYADCDCVLAGRNDNASAANSPGSTLKPFTYAAAFEQLGWGPGTEILDTPISYPDADGEPFTPRNPSGNFQGPIAVRTALGNSLNIPAFKAALYVGVPNVVVGVQEVRHDDARQQVLRSVCHSGRRRREPRRRYLCLHRLCRRRRDARRADIAGRSTKATGSSTRSRSCRSRARMALCCTRTPRTTASRSRKSRSCRRRPHIMITSILSDPNNVLHHLRMRLADHRPPVGREDRNERAVRGTEGHRRDVDLRLHAGTRRRRLGRQLGQLADVQHHLDVDLLSSSARLHDEGARRNPARASSSGLPGLSEVETCTPSGLKANAACGRKVKNLLPTDDCAEARGRLVEARADRYPRRSARDRVDAAAVHPGALWTRNPGKRAGLRTDTGDRVATARGRGLRPDRTQQRQRTRRHPGAAQWRECEGRGPDCRQGR